MKKMPAVVLLALCAVRLPAVEILEAKASANPAAKPAAKASEAWSLRLSATAHGPNVLLKDVINGEVGEPLASMALKASGRPGAELTVPKALVQLKLKNAKQDPRLAGPDVCRVSVGVQKIPAADLQRFAEDYLSAHLSGTAGATLELKGKVQDLTTYDADTRFSIKSPPQDPRGNVVLRVQVLQPGTGGEEHEVASVPMSFLVHRKEGQVYTARVYRKGDVIDGSGLSLRDEDTTFNQAQGFHSLAEVSGKTARTYIPAGKLLSTDLVELPPLIKRGDVVRVIVKSGAILVETSGKALRDARLGETLPLELETTKKQVQARCVEAGVAVREAY